MLTLNATDVVYGRSDQASVNYGWEGDNIVAGADNFGGLPANQFSTAVTPASIWAALAGQSTVYLRVFNPGGLICTISLFKNGTSASFQIAIFTVPPGGWAAYDGKQVFKFDAFGNPFTNG